MKTLLLLYPGICICMTLLWSCKGSTAVTPDDIPGTYVREWENTQHHAIYDREVGKYLIRDTIFVSRKENGYEVSNRKWRKNDYDTLGWRGVYDNYIKTHIASFDKTDSTLNSPIGMYPPMVLDQEKKLLYRSVKRIDPYRKID